MTNESNEAQAPTPSEWTAADLASAVRWVCEDLAREGRREPESAIVEVAVEVHDIPDGAGVLPLLIAAAAYEGARLGVLALDDDEVSS